MLDELRARVEQLSPLRTRLQVLLAFYGLTAVVWFATFPINWGDFEILDTTFVSLSLGFAAGTALLIFRLDLFVLEVGWGVFAYSYYIRFLDALAEGPESLESVLPGAIELLGLALILDGFIRTTGRLESSLAERHERLVVLNRVFRHNLRNDLTTIIGSLQYFEEGADDEREAEMARDALNTAHELSELSDHLRRIDSILETDDRETGTYDLGAIVEETVGEARRKYPDVTFEVHLRSDGRIDAAEGVVAAVDNVIENACQHNDAAEPVVEVTVESTSSTTEAVTVRDNGSGIPDEELEPIRQGDESALEHGSGIGLWFVHWVIERSNGTVTFEYDGGQTVTLEFPRATSGIASFGLRGVR